MADLLDQLKAALADRYAIERELGSGGMVTVYLAGAAQTCRSGVGASGDEWHLDLRLPHCLERALVQKKFFINGGDHNEC